MARELESGVAATALIKQATEHWPFIAPLLSEITSDAEYDARVEALDTILDVVGDDESHPLASLVGRIGDAVEAYDERHQNTLINK